MQNGSPPFQGHGELHPVRGPFRKAMRRHVPRLALPERTPREPAFAMLPALSGIGAPADLTPSRQRIRSESTIRPQNPP